MSYHLQDDYIALEPEFVFKESIVVQKTIVLYPFNIDSGQQ